MFSTRDHDQILCREVINLNPYASKKGSTQRSSVSEKLAATLNNCSYPVFNVDKRSVRDHVGILQNRHTEKKLRAEEKASGITQKSSKNWIRTRAEEWRLIKGKQQMSD